MDTIISQPLTNVQLELLKSFAHQLSESDLLELRKVLALFFAERLMREADRAWEEQHWTDQEVETMLSTKIRLPSR
jgi:hypothetical protein